MFWANDDTPVNCATPSNAMSAERIDAPATENGMSAAISPAKITAIASAVIGVDTFSAAAASCGGDLLDLVLGQQLPAGARTGELVDAMRDPSGERVARRRPRGASRSTRPPRSIGRRARSAPVRPSRRRRRR